ncbi:MAG: hypothetical protein JSV82_05690 [Planctomycetota bacterium]|nr:MAG: hypothetical protein JSV82_05690 [Planctomycetota bacterium]
MKILIVISIITILIIRLIYVEKKKKKFIAEFLPKLKNRVGEEKYSEALEMLYQIPVRLMINKLGPEHRSDIIDLKLKCLEKLNKIPEAVVLLATSITSQYDIGSWPKELLEKWISLYKSCDPIPIEMFYFCRECGLSPETKEFLQYIIEKEGCDPPLGFPGKAGSVAVVHF